MHSTTSNRQNTISAAFSDRGLLKDPDVQQAIFATIEDLDKGRIRVAEPGENGWRVNAWVKQAVLLYFVLRPLEPMDAGALSFFDKVPTKQNLKEAGIRVVPPGVARYGSFLEPGTILMPGYVNIGAYVGSGSMIDTWATVGSCAQIGKGVHLSGGVGIGGVLEPPTASPVIIEDGAFIGSRCVVVEGVVVEKEAVLGAGVVLTSSTSIVDVTGPEPVISKGRVPARSVVIPGQLPKQFPAGVYHVPCALIIGRRSASTDQKTSLSDALRTFQVPV
ncbi:MAG TPA: 2,3,4,5-tetrahydropyridine-2,6-dicarboxylate N-succinyltransferase [Pseudomonadota bacterium]|nr:2,3,4,5-tetrahydropyridine-2,6-dicarboxylate N-succinyltransferase [Pseudomonadota bacterium]HNK45264.1 2,3,4,5-tetrahydropyridine-2,6-dicarboxylate N-succinyltransferase [Pseudomonadota bacterium]HNO67756.1 2,3,4,5-tetrahydropyridine-2,6-dicarboxylate N-succinyltransferase [Pseudomonadota bacterium]